MSYETPCSGAGGTGSLNACSREDGERDSKNVWAVKLTKLLIMTPSALCCWAMHIQFQCGRLNEANPVLYDPRHNSSKGNPILA
jgi:hypothetical protein